MAHVIWDWNGTLLDDLPVVVGAVNACLRSQGAPTITAEEYRSRFVRPLNGFYELLLGRAVDDELMLELDHVFQRAYHEASGDASLNSEAWPAVREVSRQDATQSIASMLWHERLVPIVRSFGLDDHMLALDGNVGTVGETKEQHLMSHVGRLLDMHPRLSRDEMTVVGDISDDAVAARTAGVGCVLYDGGSQPRRVLEAEGVPVVDSLLDAVDVALG